MMQNLAGIFSQRKISGDKSKYEFFNTHLTSFEKMLIGLMKNTA